MERKASPRTVNLNKELNKMANGDYEQTGEIADLIESAEDCLRFIQEDSVGYYFYWMLEALKKMDGASNVTMFPDKRFKKPTTTEHNKKD